MLTEAGWPVLTAALPQQTTSAVAGAVTGPRPKRPVAQKVRGWIEQSLHVFRDLAKGSRHRHYA